MLAAAAAGELPNPLLAAGGFAGVGALGGAGGFGALDAMAAASALPGKTPLLSAKQARKKLAEECVLQFVYAALSVLVC